MLASEVPPSVRTQLVEAGDEYPHVQLTALDVREYAYAGVAPQVLGYLGPVNKADLAKHPDYQSLFAEVDHPRAGRLKTLAPAIRFSTQPSPQLPSALQRSAAGLSIN